MPTCIPAPFTTNLGYLPNQQQFQALNFPQSVFINQNYLNPASPFPLAFQPFGYPQAKGFVYAYSQQANLTFEQDLGGGFALSLAYNFNGGRHLNRPINANTARGDLLVKNWQNAVAFANAAGIPPTSPLYPSGPLQVQICPGPSVTGTPTGAFAPAAMLNFFRPSGLNPSLAGGPCLADAALLANADGLGLGPNGSKCDNTLPFNSAGGCVVIPFGDMDANYSNGSSDYNGFTANLRKTLSHHYQFLASYSYSHAIDDSTDLQSPLAPQDSYYPQLERSNSLFDQRHRFVFSGVYQSGKLVGDGFARKFFSNWTVAPIIDVASGRPFLIITGDNTNFQFAPSAARPNVVTGLSAGNGCGPLVPSKYSTDGLVPGGLLHRYFEHHAALARWRPRPQRRRATLDGVQRSPHRPPHQLQRTHQHGFDHGYVQPGEPVQRGLREPALDQRRTADGGVRSEAVSVRDESELVREAQLLAVSAALAVGFG